MTLSGCTMIATTPGSTICVSGATGAVWQGRNETLPGQCSLQAQGGILLVLDDRRWSGNRYTHRSEANPNSRALLRGVRERDLETTKRGNMTPDTVTCGKCGRKIGKYVEVENRIYLQIGVVRLRDGWGWCKCGTEWIWHSSDKQLEHLIERVKLCAIGC